MTLSHRLSPKLGAAAAVAMMFALGACAGGQSRTVDWSSLGGPAQPTCPLVAGIKNPSALRVEGCLNDANLASMVADPRDLVRGRPLGPAVGALQSLAIGTYLRGPVTPQTNQAGAGPTVVIGGATTTGSD